MISRTKTLFCFITLVALFSQQAAALTEEKLLEDRKNRVVHLEHAMAQLKSQLDAHNKGEKHFDDRRLKSLKKRLTAYEGQIYDASRVLTEEEIDDLLFDAQKSEL